MDEYAGGVSQGETRGSGLAVVLDIMASNIDTRRTLSDVKMIDEIPVTQPAWSRECSTEWRQIHLYVTRLDSRSPWHWQSEY